MNIKYRHKKTKKNQRGGSGRGSSGRNSSRHSISARASARANANNLSNLEASLVRLKMPNVPRGELPKHYKLPDFKFYITQIKSIEDHKILGGELASLIE